MSKSPQPLSRTGFRILIGLLALAGCERRDGSTAEQPTPARAKPVIDIDTRVLQKRIPLTGYSPAAIGIDCMSEQARTHDYQFAGIAHKFDHPINCELNPTTLPGYKGAWSNQFHTQLSRMQYWCELAEAWRSTGNTEYRDELISQMREAVARVGVEMRKQVYPDGAKMELTPWYHYTALRNFSTVLELAVTNGYNSPRPSRGPAPDA